MKNWKNKLVALSLLGTTLLGGFAPNTAFAQEELPAQVQAIKDAGVFRVGIKEDVPHLAS